MNRCLSMLRADLRTSSKPRTCFSATGLSLSRPPSSTLRAPTIRFWFATKLHSPAIEDADVFVIVLTAQQPLTAADLALLRILHGLRKERVIIFINRLDDVSDAASAHRAIMTGVDELLRREFPAAHIPIVTGALLG